MGKAKAKKPVAERGERAREALGRWLRRSKVSVQYLAADVGCSRNTLYTYLWGTRRPRPELAAAIERRTGIRAERWKA